MDTEALELFAEVMRARSFTEVARARRIAPSSVSRTITALEDELGIRLFQRSTRRLEPTEAGAVYFERISPLLSELQSARDMAADLSEEPKGTLRVTAATVFGQIHIVPLLPAIQERYPSLSVELVLTDAYLDLIEEHIDLAIRLGTLQDSSHIARRVKDLAFYICASRAYLDRFGTPKEPKEIADHDCLLFPRQGHNLNWLFRSAAGDVIEVPIRGRCLITNSQAIRDCAKSGMGLALLPDWLIENDIRSGDLMRLFPDFDVTATDFKGAIWLISPSRDYVPLKTRVFTEYLVANLRSPTGTAV
jgi:DNA-binding transcriptional LysR family regulator